MESEKMELYQDPITGQMFSMKKEQMDELIQEKEKLLRNQLIKKAEIVTYQDFVDEMINPYLPEDKKIKAGEGWAKTEPFGIMTEF